MISRIIDISVVTVKIDGFPCSSKKLIIEEIISRHSPKNFLVLNRENYKNLKTMIDCAMNCSDVDTLVVIDSASREQNRKGEPL